MKKYLLIILLFIGLPASAQVVITEIMYDLEGSDTDREWIEVRNDGSANIDLSTYKFFEANTSHGLTSFQGGNSLAAGAYGVIALKAETFLADWPGFGGLLFDSSFSLSNTGETLAIKDASGKITNEVIYSSTSGGTGDGKTLALISGNFAAANPTPGLVNEASSNDSSGGGGNAGDDGGSGGGSSKEEESISPTPSTPPKISAKIVASADTLVKIPTVFEGSVTRGKEKLAAGRFVWNFGDLTTVEIASSEKVSHVYEYPGEYVAVLEYFESSFSSTPSASARLTVKVTDSQVEITSVGNSPDVFVELTNKGSKEVNLSDWILAADTNFYIPKNTIILPNKKLVFPAKVTGFINGSFVRLYYPTSAIAALWPKVLPGPEVKPVLKKTASTAKPEPAEITPLPAEKETEPNLLGASVAESGVKLDKRWLWLLGVAGLVILGLSVIFLLKDEKDEEEFTLVE